MIQRLISDVFSLQVHKVILYAYDSNLKKILIWLKDFRI